MASKEGVEKTYHPQLMLQIYAINSSKNQQFSRIQVSLF